MNRNDQHSDGEAMDQQVQVRSRKRWTGPAGKIRNRSRADRAPLTIVTANPSAGDRGRRPQPLAWFSIIAASVVVIVVGIPVVPKLLAVNRLIMPPVQSSIVAMGDLGCGDATGSAGTCEHRDIAPLVDALDPGLVLPVVEVALPTESRLDTDSSTRVWQRLAPRFRPVPGDQNVAADRVAEPDASSPRSAGYYSYDYAGWHLIALNGDCAEVGGCGQGSPQQRWLADDLRRSTAKCTLAYWNNPRFSSARQGADPAYEAFWQDLYAAGAEIVVNGDPRGYERFARQAPDGSLDVRRGLRQFVVGTGTGGADAFGGSPLPRSVVRNGDVPGVLQLFLEGDSYRWHFVPTFGERFRDVGTGKCH